MPVDLPPDALIEWMTVCDLVPDTWFSRLAVLQPMLVVQETIGEEQFFHTKWSRKVAIMCVISSES